MGALWPKPWNQSHIGIKYSNLSPSRRLENSSDAWRGTNTRLLRDSTVVFGDGASEYGHGQYQENNTQRYMAYQTRSFLDSPATTNAVAYKIQANSIAGLVNCLYNNASYGSGGNMTLMEIAQ